MLLALRHVRPHVGFVWLTHNLSLENDFSDDIKVTLQSLMDLVENHVLGQVYTYGKLWNSTTSEYYFVPPDLENNPLEVYVKANEIAVQVLQMKGIDGIQFGTGVKHTDPVVNAKMGKLVVWDKANRKGYTIESAKLANDMPWQVVALTLTNASS